METRIQRQTKPLDVVCIGEALWDLRTAAATRLANATQLGLEPGGSAVNVALRLAAFGARTGVVGVVGADAFGTALIERLSHKNIDVQHLRPGPIRTGFVLLTTEPAGAVGYRWPKEEARALQRVMPPSFDARIVHFSGLLPSRGCIRAFVAAAKRARRDDCIVSVDANLRPRLWRGDALEKTNPFELFTVADIIKVSIDDLRLLGMDNATDFRRKMAKDAIVVVTRGAASTQALGPSGNVEVSVSILDKPQTVGAGDAFVAGCLFALLNRQRETWHESEVLTEALQRGNNTAHAMLTAS